MDNVYCKAKCPQCGAVLEDLVLYTEPPIHIAKCPECGFEKRIREIPRPPLGCKPYWVHIPERIKELCGAIERYSTEPDNHDKIDEWVREIELLNDMLDNMRFVENINKKQKQD